MFAITNADVVLRDRIVCGGTVVIDGERIVAIEQGADRSPQPSHTLDASGGLVLPGFIDVHVHGVLGHDLLDDGDPLTAIAASLPRFGVTTFCPTTVACSAEALRRVLAHVRAHRSDRVETCARVHGAHLESNFINPVMKGAQPAEYIYAPPGPDPAGEAAAILSLIAGHRQDVAVVTVAPEIPRGLDLVRHLVEMDVLVSLGHSAAGFVAANAAFDAGARHVTHLFNRMPPLGHREPGLAGAALSRREVTTEMICDGHHVHPSIVRLAVAAKGADAVVAISDGTAGAGLAPGACTKLGGRRITVGTDAAYLDEGTLAGSTLTMDGAFRMLVDRAGQPIVDAAAMCATSPARALKLDDRGAIAPGLLADLVILDRENRVTHTCVSGRVVYSRENTEAAR
jgi:N-acetylglucosamine-6-phosphate deacetylase